MNQAPGPALLPGDPWTPREASEGGGQTPETQAATAPARPRGVGWNLRTRRLALELGDAGLQAEPPHPLRRAPLCFLVGRMGIAAPLLA